MWLPLDQLLCPKYRMERRRREKAEAEASNERRRREKAEAEASNERRRREKAEAEASNERRRREKAEGEAAKEQENASPDQLPLKRLITSLRAEATKPGELVSGVTLLGFLLYGVSWYAYQRFYSSFELAPEEVGLTYGTLLVRTAVSIGMISLYIIVYLTLALAALTVGRERFQEEDTILFLCLQVFSIIAMTGYAAYLSVVYENVQDAPIISNILFFATLLIGAFCIIAPWRPVHIARTYSQRLSWLRLYRPLRLVLFGSLILFTALYIPTTLADKLAERIQGGQGLTDSLFLPYLPMNIQAAPVRVEWLQEPAPAGLPNESSFYYFGQAGELTVLYEKTTNKAYRVPSQSLVMYSR